jgi:hypothetical protein
LTLSGPHTVPVQVKIVDLAKARGYLGTHDCGPHKL